MAKTVLFVRKNAPENHGIVGPVIYYLYPVATTSGDLLESGIEPAPLKPISS
jgi:hypothetical protein